MASTDAVVVLPHSLLAPEACLVSVSVAGLASPTLVSVAIQDS